MANPAAYQNAGLIPDPADYMIPIRLAVAAPAYNEAEALRAVVTEWLDYLRGHPSVADFEVVICNDGSSDATGTILDELARDNHEVRPVHFTVNQGAAAALAAAIGATRFEWVLLTDADGQFPIENLDAMLAGACGQRKPAAIGIRQKKDNCFARFGTSSSALVCNLIYRSAIGDFNSAFKLVWGPLLRALALETRGMNYSAEVTSRLLEAGVPIAQVAIDHRPRAAGVSHMKLMRGARDRILFVAYLAMRRAMIGCGVLRRPLSLPITPNGSSTTATAASLFEAHG
jgi:glycosyltransferase involved in cell wall biosynthesis